jgi:hypothetical protein
LLPAEPPKRKRPQLSLGQLGVVPLEPAIMEDGEEAPESAQPSAKTRRMSPSPEGEEGGVLGWRARVAAGGGASASLPACRRAAACVLALVGSQVGTSALLPAAGSGSDDGAPANQVGEQVGRCAAAGPQPRLLP